MCMREREQMLEEQNGTSARAHLVLRGADLLELLAHFVQLLDEARDVGHLCAPHRRTREAYTYSIMILMNIQYRQYWVLVELRLSSQSTVHYFSLRNYRVVYVYIYWRVGQKRNYSLSAHSNYKVWKALSDYSTALTSNKSLVNPVVWETEHRMHMYMWVWEWDKEER